MERHFGHSLHLLLVWLLIHGQLGHRPRHLLQPLRRDRLGAEERLRVAVSQTLMVMRCQGLVGIRHLRRSIGTLDTHQRRGWNQSVPTAHILVLMVGIGIRVGQVTIERMQIGWVRMASDHSGGVNLVKALS